MAQAQEVFLFQPTSIGGCQLWLDASDRSTITPSGGGVMSQWTDKSGTGKTVTFAGTSNIYSPTLQAVSTDNASTSYFFANVNLKKSQIPYATVFLVHTWTGSALSGANQALWGQDIGGGWNRFQLLGFTAVPAYAYGLSYTPSSPFVTTVTGLNTGARTLYSASYAYQITNGSFAYVNGSLASSTVTEAVSPSETATTNTYFGTIDTGYAGSVAFHEIIIYTSLITNVQRQQMEGYLAWKWGLQGSLPSNHPFKNYRPLAQTPIPTQIPNMPLIGQTNQVFVPTQISGCVLWLDPADTSIITTSGSSVTQLRDKSSSRYNFVPGVSPSSGVNTINGLNVITTNGSQYLQITNYSQNFTAASFFCVIRPTQTFATWSFLPVFMSQTTGAPYFYPELLGVSPFNYVFAFGVKNVGGLSLDMGLSSIANTTYLVTGILPGNSTNFGNINGSLAPSTGTGSALTSGLTNVTIYTMGIPGFGSEPRAGQYGDILMYNRVLSQSEYQQVEGYLAWKWGLVSSLPNGHPYKQQQIAPFPFRTTAIQVSLNSWQPTRISDCAVWMDAADVSTITAPSGNVTRWNDKITNGTQFATQASWVSPTLSRQNGLNALLFVAASGTGLTLNMSATSPRATGYSYFVAYNGNANANARILHSTDGQRMLVVNNVIFFPTAQSSPTLNASANTLNVISITENTVTATVNLNGSGNAISASLTNPTFTSMTLGIGFTGLDRYDGLICEYVFYNRALTSRERQQVEGYLAWKWGGVVNLPANHPFKLFPPSP